MDINRAINKAIGKAVAERRVTAGLTQKQIPIDQGGISKIESGKLGMSLGRFREVALALGLTPGELWDTAEALLAAEIPQTKIKQDRSKASADALAARVELHAAMNLVVHDLIETIPGAVGQLRKVLQARLAVAKNSADRLLFRGLIDRLDEAAPSKPSRSSASPVRART